MKGKGERGWGERPPPLLLLLCHVCVTTTRRTHTTHTGAGGVYGPGLRFGGRGGRHPPQGQTGAGAASCASMGPIHTCMPPTHLPSASPSPLPFLHTPVPTPPTDKPTNHPPPVLSNQPTKDLGQRLGFSGLFSAYGVASRAPEMGPFIAQAYAWVVRAWRLLVPSLPSVRWCGGVVGFEVPFLSFVKQIPARFSALFDRVHGPCTTLRDRNRRRTSCT